MSVDPKQRIYSILQCVSIESNANTLFLEDSLVSVVIRIKYELVCIPVHPTEYTAMVIFLLVFSLSLSLSREMHYRL